MQLEKKPDGTRRKIKILIQETIYDKEKKQDTIRVGSKSRCIIAHDVFDGDSELLYTKIMELINSWNLQK